VTAVGIPDRATGDSSRARDAEDPVKNERRAGMTAKADKKVEEEPGFYPEERAE
jgi:hypothetical protein